LVSVLYAKNQKNQTETDKKPSRTELKPSQTGKTEPKQKKPSQNRKKQSQNRENQAKTEKTEPNRFEPVFALKNRTEPKPVGLTRFWFFFQKKFQFGYFF
jgi:hypothetical protein